jgi:hypothetical protein
MGAAASRQHALPRRNKVFLKPLPMIDEFIFIMPFCDL